MSLNYSPQLPKDKSGETIQNSPAALPAKASYAATMALGVSSVITLTDNTSVVEIEASGGNGVAIKWITTGSTNPSVISSGLAANFDHVVPSGTVRRFTVPQEVAGVTSVVGINTQAGLYKRMALTASGPTASVLATEF